jgi:hypothetical protein
LRYLYQYFKGLIMGFIEEFSRNKNTKISTIFSKGATPIASSSIQTMGGVYAVLDAKLIQGIVPVRLRLYSDQQSMIIDGPRTTASFAVSESVALIADIVLRDTNTLTFDPPVIANTAAGGLTWYNLQSVDNVPLAAAVSLTTYNLSDVGDSEESKSTINISGSQVSVTGYGVSGSFTTPKSFFILKAKGLYNFNVDQQWELGSSGDGSGWEFYQTRGLTGELHSTVEPSKVTQQFPEIPVGPTEYAAKIATRTATFWKDGNFYYLPVDVGNVYRISGWVYATYDGTANDTLFGNYQCGFFAIGADSGGTLIPDYIKAVASPSASWQYVSTDFSVAAGTSSILIGTFIDGPYPNGYGFGEPTCSAAYNLDPVACPGYGWFTGFTVENVTDYAGRLRLYSTEISDVPAAERIREFETQSSSGSNLIVDMMFDSSSFYYPLVPVVEAHTWIGSGSNISYSPGQNRVGYILENKSNVATVYSGSLNSILNIYSLED